MRISGLHEKPLAEGAQHGGGVGEHLSGKSHSRKHIDIEVITSKTATISPAPVDVTFVFHLPTLAGTVCSPS